MRTRTTQSGGGDYPPRGFLNRPREIVLGTNPASKDVIDMRGSFPNHSGKSRLGHPNGLKEGSQIAHQTPMYGFVGRMQEDFLDTNIYNVARLHNVGMSRYLYRDKTGAKRPQRTVQGDDL